MKPQFIAVANQKGGCGKTTTAVNLAACLGLKGIPTGLVDLDPQSHATLGLGRPDMVEGPGLAELMAGWIAPSEVLHSVAEGLKLLPSSWRLDDLETRLERQETEAGFLRPVLESACHDRQVVILDCPPSTGLLTRGALDLADLLLIPVETSYYALYGVGRMMSLVDAEEARRGRPLAYRILLTLFDGRTKLARQVLRQLSHHFGQSLLDTVIAVNVSLREAAGHGQPISVYRRRSRGFRDHAELCEEISNLLQQFKDNSVPAQVAAGGSKWKI